MISDWTELDVELNRMRERMKQMEKFIPVLDLPKQRRKKKSQRENMIRLQLKNSYK